MKQVYEKVLNVTNHQGNANQNHNKLSPFTWQNGYHPKDKKLQGWQGCKEKGTFLQVGGKVNWCAHYGKQYGCSSKS